MTHLLLVEDHPLYRDGLISLLESRSTQFTCHTARTAADALELLTSSRNIELVISDQILPGDVDGLALLQTVGAQYPGIARVLMSGANHAHLSHLARRHGLMGYVSKSLEPNAWLKALNSILQGDTFFSDSDATGTALTDRQTAVLQLAANGLGNRDIGFQLGLSERNVKYHLREAFARLSASSRTEAVTRAAAMGFIRLTAP
jgi:DNA-binding NarL/FixJ family response regulator